MNEATARPLQKDFFDRIALNRTFERIREALNVLLASPGESNEQLQAACRVRWACTLAARAAAGHECPLPKPGKLELVLPSRIDVCIGGLNQSVRNLERTWKAHWDLPVSDALGEVIRCCDELLEVFRLKGYDVGPAMQKAWAEYGQMD